MPIQSLLALGAAEPVLRELRYARWAGVAWRFVGGTIGRSQERAERQGWLSPCPDNPSQLLLTAAGLSAIPRLELALLQPLSLRRRRDRLPRTSWKPSKRVSIASTGCAASPVPPNASKPPLSR